jgi:hypothetical protein
MSEESLKRDQWIFDRIKERVDREWTRLDALDSKAFQTGTVATAVIGFLAGIVTFEAPHLGQLTVPIFVLFLPGLVLLLLCLLASLLASRVRRWEDSPNLETLIADYANKGLTEIIQEVGATMASAQQQLMLRNNEKALYVDYAWVALVAGISLVAIFAGVSLAILLL